MNLSAGILAENYEISIVICAQITLNVVLFMFYAKNSLCFCIYSNNLYLQCYLIFHKLEDSYKLLCICLLTWVE